MKRIPLATLVLLFLAQISASGQFKAPSPVDIDRPLSESETLAANPKNDVVPGDDLVLAARAIAVLKRLDDQVLVYRSLGDFEENRKLARVSFEVFKNDLQEVSAEVELILSRLPQSKLKMQIGNALYSYRDGEFWWRKIHQPRVVHASALSFVEASHASSDTVYASTIPYTVAIHWQQAHKYLKRAEELINPKK
jgi:hypothetical protein